MPEKIIPSLFCKGFNYLESEIRYDVNKITFKIYHETGKPVVRPLVGDYTFDKEVYSIDDEFLLGEDLLVAPAFLGQDCREVYLPQGEWEDYFTAEKVESGRFTVNGDRISVFIKKEK